MPVLSTEPQCFARDSNGRLIIPIRLATGLEGVLVRVRAVLRLWRDEWFLNRGVGTPWLPTDDGSVTVRDAILGEVYDPVRTAASLRREISRISEVRGIPDLRTAFRGENRELAVSMRLRTVFGDIPQFEEILAT